MNEITRFLSSEVTAALGWTLLHSLWQGGAIVLLLSVFMTVFRRWSPQVRYLLGLLGLLALLAAAVATFCRYYPAAFAEVDGQAGFVAVDGQAVRLFPVDAAEPDGLVLPGEWSAYLQPYLPLIVATWMMGLLVFLLRLLGQWTLVHRLRYSRSRPVTGDWQDRLRELAVQMGIRRVVQLRESLRINTPMVIGILKPVVLVPVGLLAQLSPDQVESALVHELAHIRRHDYLVNLLQALVEALFFFNPAVWWLSSLVRVEREHCCDDWAVNVLGDEVALVEALASLEEYRSRHVGLAIGLSGSRGSVLGRIRRLLYGEPQLQLPYRLVGGTLVVLALTILAAFGQANPPVIDYPFDEMTEEPFFPEEGDTAWDEQLETTEPADLLPEELLSDTIPPETREAIRRLEEEFRTRMADLEKRMQEMQRRQLEKQSSIMALENDMARQQLTLEKQRNQLERERLEKEKSLEIRRNQLQGQMLDREKNLRQLERALEEEGMKENPDKTRLKQLQDQLEKMNQEQRNLERQQNQLEGDFQQIGLEIQQKEHEFSTQRLLAEKDQQLQRNGLEREMLEWQEQMQQLHAEQRRLQYEFQLKIEELHAAQREK